MDTSSKSKIPVERGCWHSFGFKERRKWLDDVRIRFCNSTESRIDEKNETYEIDGSVIDDYPSFFLALGEAVNGPAGFFGGCLDALADCCCGGFGAKAPFTLVWKNHEQPKTKLSKEAWKMELRERGSEFLETEPSKALYDAIVEVLEEGGVNLILK